MSDDPGALRRALRKVADTVSWIHTGDAEMLEVFGPNPNQISDTQRLVGAALMFNCLLGVSGN